MVIGLELVGQRRAGTDEAHVSPEHVEKLGQLVERHPPEPAPDACDAVVSGQLEDRATIMRDLGGDVLTAHHLSDKPAMRVV